MTNSFCFRISQNKHETMKSEEEPKKPVFNEESCFGCGACDNACPAIPKAVTITSAGAKRVKCWKKV